VLFTLLVQGLTIGPVVRRLGLLKEPSVSGRSSDPTRRTDAE
jgi:NhaP-type Na+/H+ or K+/H+ antiporter